MDTPYPSPSQLVEIRQRVDAVAIGASAGGIEALNTLLPSLPAGFRQSVVVVVHLLPDRESQLPEIFRHKCRIPVEEAEDKMPIAPGTIYFAPAGYHLMVEPDKTFSLSVEPPVLFSRPSIDVLFEAAAHAWKERLCGVVLTGANEDGAKGLALIKSFGGVTLVQSPTTAVAPEMPRAAMNSHQPSWVLPLPPMAQLLASLA